MFRRLSKINPFYALASLVVLGALIVGLLVTGCSGKAREPFKDAPVSGTNTDSAETITMPDGFSNVATKCDHGNRIYVAFHNNSPYAAVAVVASDPSCING